MLKILIPQIQQYPDFWNPTKIDWIMACWIHFSMRRKIYKKKGLFKVAWMDSWQRFFMISIKLDWPQCYKKSAKSPFWISKSPPPLPKKSNPNPPNISKNGYLIFWKKLTWNIRKVEKKVENIKQNQWLADLTLHHITGIFAKCWPLRWILGVKEHY